MSARKVAIAMVAVCLGSVLAEQAKARPIVIGHRGAAGYRPEHAELSYRTAIEMGADFVEPDVVPTKDQVLIARHENALSKSTDVADHSEFAARRCTKLIDGALVTDWFSEDFTLAEIKTLRAREPMPDLRPGSAQLDGVGQVLTLREVLELAQAHDVGVYVEAKHPTYFNAAGFEIERLLVTELHRAGYRGRNSSVFIESFEVGSLKRLARMTRMRLIQLIDDANERPYDLVAKGDPRTYGDLTTNAGLAEIVEYASGIGPSKTLVIPRDSNGRSVNESSLVRRAHRLGLLVHAWTFRNENRFLPTELQLGHTSSETFQRSLGDAPGEYRQFLNAGVDGFFSDNPDTAVGALTAYRRATNRAK